MATSKSIILFDGICNLCNFSVAFIIKHDKKGLFYFAPLQSGFARKKLKNLGSAKENIDSIVLIRGREVFYQSDAVLQISRQLPGVWRLFYFFIVFPRPLRDSIYNFIARNRYNWFGSEPFCAIDKQALPRQISENKKNMD